MTLDEAIKHAYAKAEELESTCALWKRLADEKGLSIPSDYEPCKKCAEEHRQLAEWLKELKRVRELPWLKELKELREQKRPHGEWVRKNNSNSWFECSVCKEVSDVVTIMREPTWKFCPNCGADMRKKEGEEK